MKKTLAVLVLLGTLGMCTSAFGYVLEYGLSVPIKGVDANSANDSIAINTTMKAFLVMTFSDVDNSLTDANLILYGADPNKDRNLRKVFTVLNKSDANAFLFPTVTTIDDFVSFDLFVNDPFGFEMLMIGKTKSFNVGTGTNQVVSINLTGVFWMPFGLLISNTEDITATGTVTASLLVGPTRSINVDGLTQDDVVANLEATKLSRYTDITIILDLSD